VHPVCPGHDISYPAYEHEPRTKTRRHARPIVTAGAPAQPAAAAAAEEGLGGALDAEVGGKDKASKGSRGNGAAAAKPTKSAKRRVTVPAGAAEGQGGRQQRVDLMLTRARAKQQPG
jgi:hypothetical protein